MFNHAVVKFIHGDVDGDMYLENLKAEGMGKGQSQ